MMVSGLFLVSCLGVFISPRVNRMSAASFLVTSLFRNVLDVQDDYSRPL